MSKAIVIEKYGGPEVLQYKTVPDSRPGKGEVRLKHSVIGVNFIDVYHRTGLYPLELPFVPGTEAVGYVEEVGQEVEGLEEGDRVAYGIGDGTTGAYSEARNINAKYLVKVPDGVTDEQAAAVTLKGMTAHYLLRRTFVVNSKDTILIHAAAGGVGSILCQWARALGAKVIGTVGSDEKAQFAKEHGCNYVINYKTEDFVSRVREITGGIGVPVVYDSVGKDTFLKSLDCLMPLGLMVSFGQSSGKVEPFDIGLLAQKGSLFLTRPTLGLYKSGRVETVYAANEIFELVAKGSVKVHIGGRGRLSGAGKAHTALESRATTGSLLLYPD